MELKYKKDGDLLITPCPYQKNKPGGNHMGIPMVGSQACYNCNFNDGINKESQNVYCGYKQEVKQ